MTKFTDNLIALANQVKFYTSVEYIPDTITVARNGVVLGDSEVDSTFGTYILLTTAATEGDQITISGVASAGISGVNPDKNTFLERLGFNFDKTKFGSALTASGLNTSYYRNNPIKLKEWQKRFLKSGTYGNYFKNPMQSTIVSMRNNLSTIVGTIDEILIAITPIYGPFGTVINSPKVIPPGKATANSLRLLANTATQTLNELQLFLLHTDRMSGVRTTVSDDPDYETAIRVGTNITQLVNTIDKVEDFSPALGAFTSLFVQKDLAAYSNSIENFLNANNQIINIETWSASNFFDDTTIYSSDWSVINMQPTSNSFSILAADTSARGPHFKEDGTEIYFTGASNDILFQYTLSQSWNIASAQNLKTVSISAINPNYSGASKDPQDIFVSPDGKKLWHSEVVNNNDKIFEYNLSEAWNVQTAVSSTGAFLQIPRLDDPSLTDSNPRSFTFNKDGTILIVLQGAEDILLRFDLTVPWSITTAQLTSKSEAIDILDGNTIDGVFYGTKFSSDGKKMIGIDNPTKTVQQFSFEKPWDLTTLKLEAKYSVLNDINAITNPAGLDMDAAGKRIYISSTDQDAVFEYNILPSGSLDFSNTDANTMITICNEIKELVSSRRNHDKNYYLNSLRVLNDYNKMVQLTSIPNPAAIVLIRDLIGTDSLKELL